MVLAVSGDLDTDLSNTFRHPQRMTDLTLTSDGGIMAVIAPFWADAQTDSQSKVERNLNYFIS